MEERSMLRTCVLCCAMMGVVGLVVGCNNGSSSGVGKRDDAAKDSKAKFEAADKLFTALKDKAAAAAGDEKTKLEARVKEAGAKREAAVKKVDELKAAAADKWEAVKKDTDTAVEEFKKAAE
jgi:hypothetical protein